MNTPPITTPASPSLASPLVDAAFDSIETLTTSFATSAEPTLETTTVTEVALGYHRNQQYSITAMTTSTGAVAERYAYTAYGQPTILNASGSPIGNQQSQIANRFTYTGREWDETLGLHHFRARWMSPLAGRFLGRDPIGYWDGSNLYPLYFVSKAGMDPLGWSVIVVVMPVMFTCGEFTQNLPDESELPHPSKEQWKHGPNLFCGNCNGFDAYAWKNPANGKCTICMSDQKSFSRLEWIGLLIHEMTHCEQDGCKGTKGGNPPSVIEPIPLPDPKNLPGSPLERCAACDNLERPAYTRQCKFLFPADVKKRDLCIEAGVCQSCKSYCDHNPKFVKKCNGLVMPSPWFPLF